MRGILYLRDYRLFFFLLNGVRFVLNTINVKNFLSASSHFKQFQTVPKVSHIGANLQSKYAMYFTLECIATQMSNEKKNKCITSKQRNLIGVMLGLIYFYIAFSPLCFSTALSMAGFCPSGDVNRCREESQTWN